ncbi:MAG TPA: methyltransferase domain-containing protein [Longimicrobium sp.]|nr:methyltransferase domain-containing protein [Longimicrobium sp.]
MTDDPNRSADGVRGAYGRLAAEYDRRWATYNRRSLALLRPLLAGRGAGTLLDLACGTGNLVPLLAEWGTRVDRYLGADLSPEMLARAALRAALRAGRAPFSAALLAADAAVMPLRDRSVDTLVTASALHDWADAPTVLAEARRVLRPGGRLLLLDWSRERVTMRALNLWLRITRNPFRRMYTRDEAAALLAAAGFRIVAQERRAITWTWELMVFDAVAFDEV